MNATQRPTRAEIEAINDGLKAVGLTGPELGKAMGEIMKRLGPAAAKEEHGKHEICPPHVIYEAVGGGMICSGCEQRFAPANGLDVEGVMRLVNEHDLLLFNTNRGRENFRKALEAYAEKGGDNLRTYPWISVEDRMPPNNTPVLGLRADTWGDKVHVEGFAIDDGGYWYFTQDGDVPEKTPTHWMPLPSPPDTDKG